MIEARLFGSFEVFVDGKSIDKLRSRKSYCLLALLLLRSDKEVLRDYICDILWPDSPREKAQIGLRQCLNDVRGALNQDAFRISSPSTRSIKFLADGCSIDVVEFDHNLASNEPSPEQVDRLLTLYRAPLLEQYAEDFVFYERDLRAHKLADWLEREASRAFQRNRLAEASRWAKHAFRLNPLSESTCRSLMQILAAQRDIPEAIQIYTEFRQRLWRELRMEPNPETVAAYRSLKSPGFPAQASRSRTVRTTTRLIGRDAELAYVSSLILDARIVTIVGPAGVGKTRLAMEMASKGGHAFVQMAPLTVPDLLADHLIRELQVHCPEDREPIDALLDHLRTGQDVLVLDNAEHIVEACAMLVHRIVSETDDTKLLVTSRIPLGIPGEHVVHLNPLSVGPASPAVTLFVERANMTASTRINLESDHQLVSQICAGLEGIPLALELAAARLNSLSLSQVAERLDDQMKLLRAVDRTRPEGIRTMESAIRSSYSSLSSNDQRIFRTLCIFPSEFSIDLAEKLVGSADTQDAIDRLVESSMVFVAQSNSEALRYDMFEVIRQFGMACLKDLGGLEAAQSQFVDVVFELTKQAQPMIATNQRPVWLKKLTLERDNWQHALLLCSDGTQFAEMVFSLAGYLSVATQGRESAFWLRQILARRDSVAPHLVARAVAGLGIYYWEQCDAENADLFSKEALELAEAQKSQDVLARALNTRGLVLRLIGKYDESYDYAVKALQVATEIGNTNFITTFRGNVGRSAAFCGRYEEALGHLGVVYEAYVQREMPREAAAIRYAMALAHYRAGRTQQAIAQFGEALPVFLAENADIYLGWALHDFLLMCLLNGDHIASAHLFGAIRMIERTTLTKIFYSVDGDSERQLSAIRASIGDDKWQSIMDDTHEWSLEQCVEYALSWKPLDG